MEWSKSQLEAINKSGCNILVSAGAGSGKTAVLTERIIRKVLNGEDLNSLLVLTFTNKAAAEMRERIRDKVIENKLDQYKDKIDSAFIMTFDAYCQYIVKKYGYLIGVNEINLADDIYINNKKNIILDNILKEYYEDDDALLNEYFKYNKDCKDDSLKEGILKVYNQISILIKKDIALDDYFKEYFKEEKIDENILDYNKYLLNRIKELRYLFDEILIGLSNEEALVHALGLDDSYISSKYKAYIDDLCTLDNISYNQLVDFFTNKYPSAPRMSGSGVKGSKRNEEIIDVRKSFEDARKALSDKIRDIKKILISRDQIKENIKIRENLIKFIIKIEKKFIKEIAEFKKENNVYEFADIQALAIEIFEKHKAIREEVKNQFNEILIDEYQDTSNIQEHFISLISKNNVYVVGDVKQGIYRFRNACPELFNQKYNSYDVSANFTNASKGLRISLMNNFRSREEVLRDINILFDVLMSDFSAINYRDGHQMKFGLDDYKTLKKENYNLEIYRYDASQLKDDAKKEEIEAFFIAKDIINKLNNQYEVYDKHKHILRLATYKDFAILIDKSQNFELLKKVLEYFSIPTVIEADITLGDDDIIYVISALFKLLLLTYNKIYDNDYKHYLTSVLRSYLFSYSDDKIADIIINNKDNIVKEKIEKLAEKLFINSNIDIYDEMINEFDVIKKLPLIGDIEARMAILSKVRNSINAWSSYGEKIEDICDSLASICGNDKAKYSVDNSGVNAVTIMTIHKSKGLEFPVCYYPYLYKEFNRGNDSSLYFDEKYGYIVGYNEDYYGNKPEVMHDVDINKELIAYNNKIEGLRERIRLFYVALTRAREKMIIISPAVEDKKIYYLSQAKSFNDFLYYANYAIKKYIKNIDIASLSISNAYQRRNALKDIKYKDKPKYKNKSYLGNLLEKNRISKEVIEILSDEEQEYIDLGLEYHSYMEGLDFNNIDLSNIDDVNIKKNIEKVLQNDIMKNLSNAKTYHEHEFVFEADGISYHGIIDLLAVYDDHIDIIDYKLSHVDDKAYDRQLSIYKKYVESISKLPIRCYLLSLAHNKTREVIL